MVASRLSFAGGQQHLLRLAAGVCAVGAGAAALVRPSMTVHVVGVLFGLNLIVIGVVRTALLVFLSGYPVWYRVAGIGFGIGTVVFGVVCLYHRVGAVVLLLLVVAFGWVVAGVMELFLVPGNQEQATGAWWIGTGLLLMLAAGALVQWPRRGLALLVVIGAIVLIVVGLGQVTKAVSGLRAEHLGGRGS
jgi:uncharacterized membrane protein HdeD (DUF308 family)